MSPVDRFVASVASRTPAQNAAILGVSEEALLDAARPSGQTLADMGPIVSMAEAVNAEAARIGKPAHEMTEPECRHAWQRAVLAAIDPPADDAEGRLKQAVRGLVLVANFMQRIAVRAGLDRPRPMAPVSLSAPSTILTMALQPEHLATAMTAAARARAGLDTGPADQRQKCEPYARAMRRYRPRFRGDIERERSREGMRSCVDTGGPVHDAGPTAA